MRVQLTGIAERRDSCPRGLEPTSVKGGRLKAGLRGVFFVFAEFELQLAEHEPVVYISTPEGPGVLDTFDIKPPNVGMVNLVLGGVSSFRVDPGLKVSCFVLKHGVRDHQTVSHAQGQESLAIVSDWC